MKVKKFDVSRMRNPQAFEFYNKVYQKVRYSAFTDIKPYLEAMKTANEEFDVALKIIRKNIITEDITREDENRDRAWRGIRAAVQNGLNHFKPEVVLSAKKAAIILNTYGDPTRLPYTEETGVLRNLLTDLDKKLQFADHQALGIVDWLKELARANEEFARQVGYRQSHHINLTAGESKAKRQAVDAAFNKLVEMINAYVLIAEDPSLLYDAILNINQMINEESAVIKARRTRSAKKKENEPDIPDGDDGEEEDIIS